MTLLTSVCGDDWQELADLVLPNFQAYCDRHGFDLRVLRGNYRNPNWHYPYQKIAWVREQLKTIREGAWVWVLDIDILITNPSVSIEEFIVQPDKIIFIGEDINGTNAGSFLINSGRLAAAWCNEILSMIGLATSENNAIQLMLRRNIWKKLIGLVLGINQIPYHLYPEIGKQDHHSQWHPGDLVCHLPGKTPAERVQIFKEILAQ